MNILFVSISSMPHLSNHRISHDLIREFRKNGHNMYVVCAAERKENVDTYLSEEDGSKILRVKVGNNKKANLIEKGLTTIFMPKMYIKAIKKYYSDVKFDLVMYPTPPVTQYETVKFVKKRDGAKSYLLLKDIFPQNAVDIGMMKKSGVKGIIYKYFRAKEKKLYAISDRIGCMSRANVDYVLKHNPEINFEKIEICPNSIEFLDMTISVEQRVQVRKKYEIPLDKKVFIYGGNLGKPQGIPFIIDCLNAVKNNTNAYFMIVGDGTEFKKIAAWFNEEKPENMQLLKTLPKEDYDLLVAASDVGLIFLDHRFTIPNFPSRLLAYMQAGVPVLACTDPNSDIGKVVTEGGFGWWCESDDVNSFSKCVASAVESDSDEMKNREIEYLKENYTVGTAYDTIIKHF